MYVLCVCVCVVYVCVKYFIFAVLDISFAAISHQVNESNDVTVEVCKRDLIAREYLNPVAVFLSTFTIDNFVGETLLFDIPPDNPFSPTRASQ